MFKYLGGENDDDDFDEKVEGAPKKRKRENRDEKLPPLLARISGQLEVRHYHAIRLLGHK